MLVVGADLGPRRAFSEKGSVESSIALDASASYKYLSFLSRRHYFRLGSSGRACWVETEVSRGREDAKTRLSPQSGGSSLGSGGILLPSIFPYMYVA